MDLATMRELVYTDLKDSGKDVWTDDEVDRAISKALSELDKYRPQEVQTSIATTDGERDIDISSLTSRMAVEKVEFPIDEHPRIFTRFTVYGDTLTLEEEKVEGDGENCRIFWTKPNVLDGSTSTIPADLESLVALGASAYAVIAQGRYHSDRANTGGQNVDRDYAYWSRDRLKAFQEGLKKASRHNKVQSTTLYSE